MNFGIIWFLRGCRGGCWVLEGGGRDREILDCSFLSPWFYFMVPAFGCC
jgi:hypothetical protein